MPLHRLVTPIYPGGLPGTHDLINDGAITDAPFDGAKVGGDNAGTYFIAFGEDAISAAGNRPHQALAESTDFIDDVISGALPMPAELEVTAPGGAVLKVQLTGDIFVGRQSEYTSAPKWRDKLIKVVDSATGNELLSSTGAPVFVSAILDSADSGNVVGGEATGFHTNPWIYFSGSGIQAGHNYKLLFCKRGTLKEGVVDLTYLDMLPRLFMDGAPKVAGEVERFMHSSSRRSGTAVTALTASLIETPGTGDNVLPKSSVLTVDIDPSDDVGSVARQLLLKAGGGLFCAIEENVKGGTTCRVKAGVDTLELADTTTSGTNGGIPLSSVAHPTHFVMDADAGATPSILEMHNRRWTATCGDGTNTFGDFNGSTAIKDAIDFFVANAPTGMNGLVLYVKAGNYTFTASYTLPVAKEITIIGTGKQSTTISNGIGTATSPSLVVPNNGGGAQPRLTVEGVTFAGSSTGEVAITTSSYLKLVACEFNDQYLEVVPQSAGFAVGRPFLHATDCFFSVAGLTGAPCVLFTSTEDTFTARGLILEDCVFYSSADAPVLRVTGIGPLGASYYQGVLFNRCSMNLDTGTASGGNPGGNTGVLELLPAVNDNLVVQDIEWRDCAVSVQTGSGDTGLLLYLRTDDGARYIECSKVSIVGGRWDVAASTVISPFYIGGETYDAAVPHVDEVIIEGAHMGFSSASSVDYGNAATEVAGPALQADWAAFFISALNLIRIQNLTFLSPTVRSGSGDLYLRGAASYSVDGIHVGPTWVNTGDNGTPSYRVYVMGASGGSSGRVEDIRVSCGNPANAVCSDYIIQLSPNGRLVVRDCLVENHNVGTAHGYGIPWETTLLGGLHLLNCVADTLAGDGFRVYQAAGETGTLVGLDVKDCTFTTCDVGITVGGLYNSGSGTAIYNVNISNNLSISNAGYGLWLAPGAWSAADASVVVANNVIRDNISSAGVQVNIGGDQGSSGEAWGDDANCVIMGNILGGSSQDALGQLQVILNGALAFPFFTTGCHTGYDAFTSTGPVLVGPTAGNVAQDDRAYTTGKFMVLNHGILTNNQIT